MRYATAPSAAPSDPQAVARREPIRDQPAQQIAGHADDERQAREDAETRGVEPVPLPQVGRQPGDAEVEDHAVRDVHDAERDHVPAAEQRAPVLPARRRGRSPAADPPRWSAARRRSPRRARTDRCGTTCARPRPRPGRRAPKQTKIVAPGHELEQPEHQRRRQAADQVGAGEEDALDRPALATGIQRENVRATHGHAPASPTPNRKRMPSRTG